MGILCRFLRLGGFKVTCGNLYPCSQRLKGQRFAGGNMMLVFQQVQVELCVAGSLGGEIYVVCLKGELR